MSCPCYLTGARATATFGVITMFVFSSGGPFALGDPASIAQRVNMMLAKEHHAQQLLVRFNAGTPMQTRETVHANAGAVLHNTYRHMSDLCVVEVPSGDLSAALNEYLNDPNLMYAEPNYRIYPTGVPNDPDFGVLWGMHNIGQEVEGQSGLPDADIDAPEAWDIWTGDDDTRLMGRFVLTGRPIMAKLGQSDSGVWSWLGGVL